MSVRVNLLPAETSAAHADARQRQTALGAGVLFVVALAGVSLWQNGRIGDAQDRLATEEQVLAALTQEQTQLQEFADLESLSNESREQVAVALGAETSFAGILQDVASIMPSDAELESVAITIDPSGLVSDPDAVAADGAPAQTTTMGTLVAVGSSLNSHAPGLERLLLEFDKVAAFHDVFFTSSVLADPDEPYPTFTIETQLGSEVLTERYEDGVPEVAR